MISKEFLQRLSRAALGIALGSTIATLLAAVAPAFAATVKLGDGDFISAKIAMAAIGVWFLTRLVRVR